jgi:DNA mismatch repair protein MutS2
MDTQTLHILDYFRVRDTVAAYCVGDEGRARLSARLPLQDEQSIDALKQEAAEWTRYLTASFPEALTPWPPLEDALKHLTTPGDTLTVEQAHGLLLFCRGAALFVSRFSTVSAVSTMHSLPILAGKAASLPDLGEAIARIARIINKDGTLRDLPELQAIRKNIEHIRADLDGARKRHLAANGAAFQSRGPALRGGRQVLAVKAQHKGKIRGIIHEVSQSGQTVYIEPEEVVQKNNDLAQEEFRLAREIRRILQSLTADLAPRHGDYCAGLVVYVTFIGKQRWYHYKTEGNIWMNQDWLLRMVS